jgi:hypothetical protein
MLKKFIWRQTCLVSALAVCLVTQACRTVNTKDGDTNVTAVSPNADREVVEKLKRITIPRLHIDPVTPSIFYTIIKATELFYLASLDYDHTWNPSEQRGVRFAARLTGLPTRSNYLENHSRFLETPSGSLFDSLTFACAAMGTQFSVQNGNVIILPKGECPSAMRPPTVNSPADRQVISNLKSIILPKCTFVLAGLPDVVEYFQQASRDYDWRNVPAEQLGVNFALRVKEVAEDNSARQDKAIVDPFIEVPNKTTCISIPEVRSCSLYDLLLLTCDAAGMTFEIHNGTVIIMPREEPSNSTWQAQTIAKLAKEANISQAHAQKLWNDMENFVTSPVAFRNTDTGADFINQCKGYAQTNDIPFNNVIHLMLNKIELELDAFNNDAPQLTNMGVSSLDRCYASINMIRSLNNPIVFSFLYRMAQKKGRFQNIFCDIYYGVLLNRPASEIRHVFNDPELRKRMNLPELWLTVVGRMYTTFDDSKHVFTPTGERLDELVPFVVDYLPIIINPCDLLNLEHNLNFLWPEYRISIQRSMIWTKIKSYEGFENWQDRKNNMEKDFKNAPPGGFRLDLRKKYNTLPPPVTDGMPKEK